MENEITRRGVPVLQSKHNRKYKEPAALTKLVSLEIDYCVDMPVFDYHKAFSALTHRLKADTVTAATARLKGYHLMKFVSRGLGVIEGVKYVRVWRIK